MDALIVGIKSDDSVDAIRCVYIFTVDFPVIDCILDCHGIVCIVDSLCSVLIADFHAVEFGVEFCVTVCFVSFPFIVAYFVGLLANIRGTSDKI